MANLGKAYVQIVPTSKGIAGSISNALSGEGEAAGASTGMKIASFMKKAFVTAGVGKALMATLKEGARYEQARGGIETLFGAKGAKNVQEYANIVGKSVTEVEGEYNRLKGVEDKMMQNANSAWKTAGISANEYMEQSTSFAAALLQSVGGSQEKAAEAANQAVIDMSDNANKFGTNITDIQNSYQGFAKQNYSMLDNLRLGYGGTKSEMERLLADAEKISGVHYDINNLSDVYSAIHVIQESLGVTGTTAREASTTLSGSFASMKASASNFMAQLVTGENVDQAMTDLLDSSITFAGNLVKAVGQVLVALPEALGTLGDSILQKIQSSADDTKFASAAGDMILKFGIGLIKGLPKLAAALLALSAYVVDRLGLIAGYLIVKGYNAISEWASGMWNAFTAKATQILDNMKTAVATKFDSIKQSIAEKASAAMAVLKSKFAAAKNAIVHPFEVARDKVRAVINKIKNLFPIRAGKIFSGLKIPRFSVQGGKFPWGIGGEGSKPVISLSWHKQGAIFKRPYITAHGFGEAGAEAALPLDPFWSRMDQWGSDILDGVQMMSQGQYGGDIVIPVYLYPNGPEMDRITVNSYDRGKRRLK